MGKEIIRGWLSDHSFSLLRRDERHTNAVILYNARGPYLLPVVTTSFVAL